MFSNYVYKIFPTRRQEWKHNMILTEPVPGLNKYSYFAIFSSILSFVLKCDKPGENHLHSFSFLPSLEISFNGSSSWTSKIFNYYRYIYLETMCYCCMHFKVLHPWCYCIDLTAPFFFLLQESISWYSWSQFIPLGSWTVAHGSIHPFLCGGAVWSFTPSGVLSTTVNICRCHFWSISFSRKFGGWQLRLWSPIAPSWSKLHHKVPTVWSWACFFVSLCLLQ